jgi:hypothetical protein
LRILKLCQPDGTNLGHVANTRVWNVTVSSSVSIRYVPCLDFKAACAKIRRSLGGLWAGRPKLKIRKQWRGIVEIVRD